MQTFKLPEPVLCIGGYLQIELLGRVQRQEMDDLFYIWLVFQLVFLRLDIGHVFLLGTAFQSTKAGSLLVLTL